MGGNVAVDLTRYLKSWQLNIKFFLLVFIKNVICCIRNKTEN